MRVCEYLKILRFNLTSLTPTPLPPAGEGLESMLFDAIFTLRAILQPIDLMDAKKLFIERAIKF